MQRKVIGLTGGVASGKSLVSHLFSEYAVSIVDTDVISRHLIASNVDVLRAIRDIFGDEAFLSNGAINRIILREKAFQDTELKLQLEAILHPIILEQSKRALSESNSKYSLLVVPLLFETKIFLPLISRSLLVDCEESLQISRVIARDGINKECAKLIMSNQFSRHERLLYADDVIMNDNGLDCLYAKVKIYHLRYLSEF